MNPKFWTDTRIAKARVYLATSASVAAAAEAMRERDPEFARVTPQSLRNGMIRHAGTRAADCLRRDDPPDNGRTIIVPDLHAPYHDARAWDVCLAAIETLKPERVVVIGDMWDFYAVSSFDKDPARGQRLIDELGTVRPEIRRFAKAIGSADLIVCQGNHEFRLDKYIAKHAGALHGLPGMSARELMLQDMPQAKWVKYRAHEKIGHVIFTHEIGYSGIYAGRHSLVAAGTNIVFGHTHRGGVVIDGDHQGDRRFSLNVGWLGDLRQIDYMHEVKTRDWAAGFGYMYTDADTGMVWPAFVPILRDRCHVAGRTVRV